MKKTKPKTTEECCKIKCECCYYQEFRQIKNGIHLIMFNISLCLESGRINDKLKKLNYILDEKDE